MNAGRTIMNVKRSFTGLDEGIVRGLKSRTFVTAGERAPACGAATRPCFVIANEVKQSTAGTLWIASGFAHRNDEHTKRNDVNPQLKIIPS